MASRDRRKGEGAEGCSDTEKGLEIKRGRGSITPLPEWPGGNCFIHFTQQLNMFCKQYSQLLCVDCYCSKHPGHPFVPVSQKEEEVRKNLTDALKNMETELYKCESRNRDLTDKVAAAKSFLGEHLRQLWDHQTTAITSLKEQHQVEVSKLNDDLASRSSMVKQEFTTAVVAAKAWCDFVTRPLETAFDEGVKATREGRRFIRATADELLDARLPQLLQTSDDVNQVLRDLPDNKSCLTRQLQSPAGFSQFTSKIGAKVVDTLTFAKVEAFRTQEDKKRKQPGEKLKAEDKQIKGPSKKSEVKQREGKNEIPKADKTINKTNQPIKDEEDTLHKKLVQKKLQVNSTGAPEQEEELVLKGTGEKVKWEQMTNKAGHALKVQTSECKLSGMTETEVKDERGSKQPSAGQTQTGEPKNIQEQQASVKGAMSNTLPECKTDNALPCAMTGVSSSSTPIKEHVTVGATKEKGLNCKQAAETTQDLVKQNVLELRKKLKHHFSTMCTPYSKSLGYRHGYEVYLGDIAIMETDRQGLLIFITDSSLPSFKFQWNLDARPLRWSYNANSAAAVDIAFLRPQAAESLSTLIGGAPLFVLKGQAPCFVLTSMSSIVKYVHCHVSIVVGQTWKEIGDWFLPAKSSLQEALECVVGFPPTRIIDDRCVNSAQACSDWARQRRSCNLFVI